MPKNISITTNEKFETAQPIAEELVRSIADLAIEITREALHKDDEIISKPISLPILEMGSILVSTYRNNSHQDKSGCIARIHRIKPRNPNHPLYERLVDTYSIFQTSEEDLIMKKHEQEIPQKGGMKEPDLNDTILKPVTYGDEPELIKIIDLIQKNYKPNI